MDDEYKIGMFSYHVHNRLEYAVVLEKVRKSSKPDIGRYAVAVYQDYLKPAHINLKSVRWFELIEDSIKEVLFGVDGGFFDPQMATVYYALGEGVKSIYGKISAQKERGVIYEIDKLWSYQ